MNLDRPEVSDRALPAPPKKGLSCLVNAAAPANSPVE